MRVFFGNDSGSGGRELPAKSAKGREKGKMRTKESFAEDEFRNIPLTTIPLTITLVANGFEQKGLVRLRSRFSEAPGRHRMRAPLVTRLSYYHSYSANAIVKSLSKSGLLSVWQKFTAMICPILPLDGCNLLESIRNMSAALTHYWQDFIDQMIESGRYNNRSEVIRAGLRALEERELTKEGHAFDELFAGGKPGEPNRKTITRITARQKLHRKVQK